MSGVGVIGSTTFSFHRCTRSTMYHVGFASSARSMPKFTYHHVPVIGFGLKSSHAMNTLCQFVSFSGIS